MSVLSAQVKDHSILLLTLKVIIIAVDVYVWCESVCVVGEEAHPKRQLFPFLGED